MTTVYHGTSSIINKFNFSTLGANTYNNAGAVYFTSDKEVAMHYSIEAFKRKNEWLFDYNNLSFDLLNKTAVKQKHVYKCKLDIKNPLIIDINNISRDNTFCVLDSFLLNHIIAILQNNEYQNDNSYYHDDDIYYKALDFLQYNEILDYYDKELDEYIEKDVNFDCIIIHDCIDSINEDTNYMPSTIYAVLKPEIIKIEELIRD